MSFKEKKNAFLKVTDDIFLIFQDSMSSMNFNTCNTYILKLSENEYILIDPGCSRKKFNTTLKKNNIEILDIKHALLTHAHSDHMNLLDFIRKKNENIKVWCHEADKKYVESASEYYNMLFNFSLIKNNEKYRNFIDAVEFYTTPNSTAQLNSAFKMVFDIWNIKNRKVDKTFKDGDILPGGLKVIHAPGHTPGMCFFYKEQEKILFSSDIHLSRIGANVNGNYANIASFKKSIKKLSKLVDENKIKMILSGHGNNPIVNNLKDRIQNFFDTLSKQEDRIINLLKTNGPLSLEELTDLTFKDYVRRFDKYLNQYHDFMDTITIAEASELLSNLNYMIELENLNRVKKIVIGKDEKWTIMER